MSEFPGYATPPGYGNPPAYGAPGYGAGPYQPFGQPPSQQDGLAITSLVLGIVWLGGLGSLLAVIFGHVSRGRAAREQRPKSGLALAGLILGYLGLAGTLVFVLLVALVIGTAEHGLRTVSFNSENHQAELDLSRAGTAEETYFTDHNAYTSRVSDLSAYAFAPGTNVQVSVISADDSRYCVSSQYLPGGTVFYLNSDLNSITTTPCS